MKWQTDAAGNMILCAVTGFHIAPAAETTVLARIEFARTPKDIAEPEALQFVLSPTHALKLAGDLRKTAEHILARPRPSKPN